MSSKPTDRKRRRNARLAARQGLSALFENDLADRRIGDDPLRHPRGPITTEHPRRELPRLEKLEPGMRIIDRSAHAVAIAKNGVFLGLFAIGDWEIS